MPQVLRNIKKNYDYEGILRRQNSSAISSQASPASLLDISVGNYQGALVGELWMIRNQMRAQNTSEIVAVQASPCAPTPQK
jgi:hypothetical protein